MVRGCTSRAVEDRGEQGRTKGTDFVNHRSLSAAHCRRVCAMGPRTGQGTPRYTRMRALSASLKATRPLKRAKGHTPMVPSTRMKGDAPRQHNSKAMSDIPPLGDASERRRTTCEEFDAPRLHP